MASGLSSSFSTNGLCLEHVYGFIERYGDGGKEARIYIAKSIGPRWIQHS